MIKNKNVKNLHIDGQRTSGLDLRQGNVRACSQLANMMKSSFGPQGLDKMLVNNVGDITITNDGAEILKELQVEHPAAQVLVKLAKATDHQVGDGTTSVVILAAELLKAGLSLIENDKIHATNVIEGYRIACDESLSFMKKHLILEEELSDELLLKLIRTTMNSKIIGNGGDYFANLILKGIKGVKKEGEKGDKYPIKMINIVKKHGKSMKESELIDGYALGGDMQTRLSSYLMPRVTKDCKIAFLDVNLQKTKLKLGIEIDINDPEKLEKVKQQEIEVIKKRIELMIKAGCNVVMTTKGIDALCSDILMKNNCIGIRRCYKDDLKRLCELTGGKLITDFTGLDGEEHFNTEDIGYADMVTVERISDDDVIFVRGCREKKTCSIVLRGANEYMLEEMDRSVHDCLMAAKKVLESRQIVAGGGAVEAALSLHLEDFARKIETREQLSIAEFSEALLVIPKTLAINAALDSTELVAKMRAMHHQGFQDMENRKKFLQVGLDLKNNTVNNSLENGVVEPALVKMRIIKFATEAAITILRIDDMFRLNEKEKPDPRRR